MIIGIGTDIIRIERVISACQNKRFIEKYFTENEINAAANKTQSIAGAFACKESAAKALGTGFAGFGLRDIEVLHDERGRPVVNLYNGALERFCAIGGKSVFASISHCEEYATAVVVIEGG